MDRRGRLPCERRHRARQARPPGAPHGLWSCAKLQAITRIPKPRPRRATRSPMAPRPSRPSVLPSSSGPSTCCHVPCRRRPSLSGIARVTASIKPKVSSATDGAPTPARVGDSDTFAASQRPARRCFYPGYSRIDTSFSRGADAKRPSSEARYTPARLISTSAVAMRPNNPARSAARVVCSSTVPYGARRRRSGWSRLA